MSQPAFDLDVDPAADPTYTVGELAAAVNDSLRRRFGDGVWVRGEIGELNARGPHTYFSLVEHTDEGKAVLNVQLFAPMKRNLTPVLKRHRLELAPGMKVRIFGRLDFYAPSGRLGLTMSGIDPRFTLGELAMARDEIVRRLIASGKYDANRRRVLSPVPLRVGVATSIGSAAWHDFISELHRSGFGFRLAAVDVRVQGAGADTMVARAITALGRRNVDVVVVIRGGGARNELATFDSEQIAHAIASCPLPVLTGLGHETDRSIADEVAHTSLKTPTACAGALVDAVRVYVECCEATWAQVESRARRRVDAAGEQLGDRAHRIAHRTRGAVAQADARLAGRIERLRSRSRSVVDGADERLARAADRLAVRPAQLLAGEERVLASLVAQVAAHDPVTQLRRGWSITRTDDGLVVRSRTEVAPGDVLHTQLVDGVVISRADDIDQGVTRD